MGNTFARRVSRLASALTATHHDAVIVTHSSNLQYLTGYAVPGDERLLAYVVTPDGRTTLIANELYRLQVEDIRADEKVFWNDGADAHALLARHLQQQLGERTFSIAIEATASALHFTRLQAALPGSRLATAESLLDPLRAIKDAEEIENLEASARLAETALDSLLAQGTGLLGRTERELQQELASHLQDVGAPGSGLIAVGANAAEPHHVVDNTVVRAGSGLLIDYGARFSGYWSDSTRTVHFGEPSEKFVRVYEAVRTAYELGIEAARPGNLLSGVDRAARASLEDAGLGEYFNHRTGHGIGLDVHEFPAVSGESEEIIQPGQVFTVEPGVYLPGEFGVRIESVVVIEDHGPRVLHRIPTQLRVLS